MDEWKRSSLLGINVNILHVMLIKLFFMLIDNMGNLVNLHDTFLDNSMTTKFENKALSTTRSGFGPRCEGLNESIAQTYKLTISLFR